MLTMLLRKRSIQTYNNQIHNNSSLHIILQRQIKFNTTMLIKMDILKLMLSIYTTSVSKKCTFTVEVISSHILTGRTPLKQSYLD